MSENDQTGNVPLFDSRSDRVNVWMRYGDRWVIHTKGATRYHASLYADTDHPVLPVDCPNDPCAFADCVSHGHCCAITPHDWPPIVEPDDACAVP